MGKAEGQAVHRRAGLSWHQGGKGRISRAGLSTIFLANARLLLGKPLAFFGFPMAFWDIRVARGTSRRQRLSHQELAFPAKPWLLGRAGLSEGFSKGIRAAEAYRGRGLPHGFFRFSGMTALETMLLVLAITAGICRGDRPVKRFARCQTLSKPMAPQTRALLSERSELDWERGFQRLLILPA